MNKVWHIFLAGVVMVLSARAEAPLPPVAEVLAQVVARAAHEQENDRAFATQYTFQRSKVTDYRNGRGELKKHEVKTSLYDPVAEAANDRQRALASAGKKAQPVSNTHTNLDARDFDKKNVLANPDLLDRFDFKLVGRVTTNGRTALVLDFQPKHTKLPERELKDKFINKAAGRVWVDEAESAVIKADLHLCDRVDILGGLVASIWRFTFGFERERTSEGFWYARDVRWHLEGREVIVNRSIDFRESKVGVRKVAPAGWQTASHDPSR